MLEDHQLYAGLQSCDLDPFAVDASVAYPQTIDSVISNLQNGHLNAQDQLPHSFPMLIGNRSAGHWVTLVLHADDNGQRCATLFNSIAGEGSSDIMRRLAPSLRAAGFEHSTIVAHDLQNQLHLSCGVFTVAAIDAVTHRKAGTTVNQALRDFANECQRRSTEEQVQWDADWREVIELVAGAA